MKTGIQSRLMVTTTLVLGTFLTLTGVVLDRSFRASVLSGAEEQLRLVIYSLMGVVEARGPMLLVAEPLPEPRLGQPGSGLYAWITDPEGWLRWRSPSALAGGVAAPEDPIGLQPGEFRFRERVADPRAGAEHDLLYLGYAVIWEDTSDTVLTFQVAADWAPFQASIAIFRRNLLVGLGAVTLLFIFAQFLAVRWGLRPLRTMAQEVREMEEGRREQLSETYPRELTGLAENLGRFVAHEQRSRSRYRKAMEDLAHSLKTPLAVLRNALERVPEDSRPLLEEQLDRMQNTVAHQLSRAAVSGPVIVGRPLQLTVLVDRLVRALRAAYRQRAIEVRLEVPEELYIRGDERDLMEILGNLLENAFKYTYSVVRVRAFEDGMVQVEIDDDGPGIPPAVRAAVLARGTRADEVQPGQGIGLAMVAELVALYQGQLSIDDSDLGGARLRLELR